MSRTLPWPEVDAYIALGGNLGERAANLAAARARLAQGGWLRVVRCSPLYETEPWGAAGQPRYLNQVCHVRSALPPRALMRWLLAIEQLGGRDRAREGRWGARPIDLDLLAYDDLCYHDALVTLPHPRLHLRRFVLQPLRDVAPAWRHPASGQSVSELLAALDDPGELRPYQPAG